MFDLIAAPPPPCPDRRQRRRAADRSRCWASATASTGTTSRRSPTSPARPPRPGWPRRPTPSSTETSPGTRHGHGGDLEIRAHDAGPGAATLAPALATRPAVGATAVPVGPGRGDPARHALRARSRRRGHRPRPGRDRVRGPAARLARPDHGPDRRASPSSPSACGSCTRSTATPAPASGSGCAAAGCSCSTAIRYGWRRFQARIHGHEHVEPLEMSSYGAKTSFGVGMIHGIGAETGTPGPADRRGRRRVERGARRADAVRLRDRPAASRTSRSCCSARSASCRARPASGSTSRSARSPACSACSSGRSSCSASTAPCRTSERSCRSDPGPASRRSGRGAGAGAAAGAGGAGTDLTGRRKRVSTTTM